MIKTKIYKIMLAVVALVLIIVGLQLAKIYFCIKQGHYNLQPWQHINPSAKFKVLFAGDSTAVGTGLVDNAQSTSGLFSRDFPEADVENYSRNGLRLKGLEDVLNTLQDKKFDLAVIQIGANDILNFTPLAAIRQEQRRILDLTQHIAPKIIILHSGDIGQAPMFIWPFTWIYTWRSLKVRQIYINSQNDKVAYVDIYTLNKGRNLSQGYAKDNLHLNKEGYASWYSYIKNQLQSRHWLPPLPIRYVAIGDSYTIGTGASPDQSWPALITSHLKTKGVTIELMANLAHNGWTTQDLIDYELPALKELQANFVTVLIGTNDWVQGVDVQVFQENIHKIFSQLLTMVPDATRILIVTIPDFSTMPAGRSFSGGRDIAHGLAAFNQIIQSQAQDFGLRVVDVYPLSQTLASLVSSDGLHPSAQGYARWADLIEPFFPQK